MTDSRRLSRLPLSLLLGLFLCWSAVRAVASVPDDRSDTASNAVPILVLVAGTAGEPEFGTNFVRQVELWSGIARRARASPITIGVGGEPRATNDLQELNVALAAQAKEGREPLWLILVGHGTWDGAEARFNLRGPDLTATQLAEWLKPFQRPLIVINTASASAPFLNKLSATNRVIVTATRSGTEQNFTRFGQYFAATLNDAGSDLDKDGQTSVLEAFLAASAGVREFYKTEGRLATEHALIDDNGDGLGTPADWFRGVRVVKKAADAKGAPDGTRAHQYHLVLSQQELSLSAETRARRDAIELAIAKLRENKGTQPEEEYYQQLQGLVQQLVAAYEDQL